MHANSVKAMQGRDRTLISAQACPGEVGQEGLQQRTMAREGACVFKAGTQPAMQGRWRSRLVELQRLG